MTNESTSLEKNSDACKVIMAWWKNLDNERGDRADLRRCHNIAEVVFNPTYHELWLKLNKTGFRRKDSVALIAGALAHVKSDQSGEPFAAQMASPKSGPNSQVSGLRFKRLLKIEDNDDLFISIVRVVKLMDGNVNVCNLANSLYWWNDITKKQWAYSYYEKAPRNNN